MSCHGWTFIHSHTVYLETFGCCCKNVTNNNNNMGGALHQEVYGREIDNIEEGC